MENQNKRAVDLAVAAGRKRQSPRTGFVHLFPNEETFADTIPIFENFCFAMALFRQKSVESIREGKELIERLLAFQTAEGNFPIYLHDFPRCYDHWMGLKVAPILLQIQRRFGNVVGAELKEKMSLAYENLMRFAAMRNRPPLWEHRYLKLQGKEFSFQPVAHEEWFHWLVSEQLNALASCPKLPYHPAFQAFIGGSESQEKGEPRPVAIEWALAEKQGFSERLLRDHPAVLQSAILFPIEPEGYVFPDSAYHVIPEEARILWKGRKLHSFSAPKGKMREPNKIFFDLSEPFIEEKGDLVEAAVFSDISSETEVTIGGKKGTVFSLGDSIEITTPSLTIKLRFDLVEGEGDFCGHISRANRPAQTACKGAFLYEAFDWRIAMRTLRRSSGCQIVASIQLCNASS